jgi:hypothetical protein
MLIFPFQGLVTPVASSKRPTPSSRESGVLPALSNTGQSHEVYGAAFVPVLHPVRTNHLVAAYIPEMYLRPSLRHQRHRQLHQTHRDHTSRRRRQPTSCGALPHLASARSREGRLATRRSLQLKSWELQAWRRPGGWAPKTTLQTDVPAANGYRIAALQLPLKEKHDRIRTRCQSCYSG